MHMFRMNYVCLKCKYIYTAEGGGKMDLNKPVVGEEDEEDTLGPKIWSKHEDDEAAAIFFFSIPKLCRWKRIYV